MVASGDRAQAVVRAQHRVREGCWQRVPGVIPPSPVLPSGGREPEARGSGTRMAQAGVLAYLGGADCHALDPKS